MMADFARRWPALALIGVFAVLSLAGCGSNPMTDAVTGVFDKDDDEDDNAPKEEDRISILALEETLEADPRYAGATIDLPPSYQNDTWPQPGGEADHTLHHLSAGTDFEVAWKVDIGSASSRAVLTSPPIVADGFVFVMDAEARISAYKVETGERVWRAELTPDIDEKFRIREILSQPDPAEIGFGGGLAYEDGKIFVSSGFRFVAAISSEDGKELWRIPTDAPVRTPPTAYRGAVYVVTNTNEFLAISQETGEELWNFQSFEESARILSSASPAAAGDLVVAPFSSGELIAFLSDAGRPVWNETLTRNTQLTALATLNDIAGSPVIDRGLVYVVSHAGRLAAIDIRTGQSAWEVSVASLQMPWVAGDFIYVVSVDGELVCISRNDGAVVWVSQLPRYKNPKKRKGRIAWAGPVLVNDNLILVSTEGDIVKASPQNGEVLGTKEIADGFIVTPIVAADMIFVLSEKGKMFALR